MKKTIIIWILVLIFLMIGAFWAIDKNQKHQNKLEVGQITNIYYRGGVDTDYIFLKMELFNPENNSEIPDYKIVVDYKNDRFIKLQNWFLSRLLTIELNGEEMKIGK